jgi:hypothetical protein
MPQDDRCRVLALINRNAATGALLPSNLYLCINEQRLNKIQ